MSGADRPVAGDAAELTIHNEGRSVLDVRTVVHGDRIVARSMRLEGGETGSLSAPVGASVEVHAPGGTATTLVDGRAFFVVRDRRVLVVPSRTSAPK